MPQAYLLKSVMKVVRGADSSCIVSAKILMSCLICETLLYLLVVPECHPPPVVHGFDAVIEFCKIYAYSDFTIRFWDGMAFSICAITLSTSANQIYWRRERGDGSMSMGIVAFQFVEFFFSAYVDDGMMSKSMQ